MLKTTLSTSVIHIKRSIHPNVFCFEDFLLSYGEHSVFQGVTNVLQCDESLPRGPISATNTNPFGLLIFHAFSLLPDFLFFVDAGVVYDTDALQNFP